MKIFIAVTHLLGIGHLARMRVLARGLAKAGHQVTLASGGRPAPHLDYSGFTLVQLPSVHCVGVDFSTLYESDGVVLTDSTREKRRACLLDAFHNAMPDLVITETFPFGRRALKTEFLALCEAAAEMRPRPALVASIRDILNPPSSPQKAEEADALITRFYDGILVHGDARFVDPQAGWPFSAQAQRLLHMTGYIDEGAPPSAPAAEHHAILVSGGGSAASLPLYRAALAAAAMMPHQNWHLLIGHGVSAHDFKTLEQAAPESVKIERARPDFRSLLQGARVSVSQAGYNTIVDLLTTSTPMVLVPFAAGTEQEQTLRAQALAAHALAAVVPECELNATTLMHAIDQAIARGPRNAHFVARDGVAGSLAALERIVAARHTIEAAWQKLSAHLSDLKKRNERLIFWWRDDDAIAPSQALDHLLHLSRHYQAPVALAVIPDRATSALAVRLADTDCDVLIHGVAHHNHAPAGHKKQELGFQPVAALAAQLQSALTHCAALFGARALPVLVPPWNRIDPDLIALLPDAGLTGLSTFKPRPAEQAVPGLRQINTHCDPIDWRGGGGLLPEAALVDTLSETIAGMMKQRPDAREPLGLLTHHLIHDDAIWAFIDRLLHTLATSGAVTFVPARQIFERAQTLSRDD